MVPLGDGAGLRASASSVAARAGARPEPAAPGGPGPGPARAGSRGRRRSGGRPGRRARARAHRDVLGPGGPPTRRPGPAARRDGRRRDEHRRRRSGRGGRATGGWPGSAGRARRAYRAHPVAGPVRHRGRRPGVPRPGDRCPPAPGRPRGGRRQAAAEGPPAECRVRHRAPDRPRRDRPPGRARSRGSAGRRQRAVGRRAAGRARPGAAHSANSSAVAWRCDGQLRHGPGQLADEPGRHVVAGHRRQRLVQHAVAEGVHVQRRLGSGPRRAGVRRAASTWSRRGCTRRRPGLGLVQQRLGRGVVRRHHLAGQRAAQLVRRAGDAEIGQRRAEAGAQDVRRLDVAVDDADLVGGVQRLADLDADLEQRRRPAAGRCWRRICAYEPPSQYSMTMYGRSSSVMPVSMIETMCGWLDSATVVASSRAALTGTDPVSTRDHLDRDRPVEAGLDRPEHERGRAVRDQLRVVVPRQRGQQRRFHLPAPPHIATRRPQPRVVGSPSASLADGREAASGPAGGDLPTSSVDSRRCGAGMTRCRRVRAAVRPAVGSARALIAVLVVLAGAAGRSGTWSPARSSGWAGPAQTTGQPGDHEHRPGRRDRIPRRTRPRRPGQTTTDRHRDPPTAARSVPARHACTAVTDGRARPGELHAAALRRGDAGRVQRGAEAWICQNADGVLIYQGHRKPGRSTRPQQRHDPARRRDQGHGRDARATASSRPTRDATAPDRPTSSIAQDCSRAGPTRAVDAVTNTVGPRRRPSTDRDLGQSGQDCRYRRS